MITCRELIDFLDDYVANDMEPSRRRTVDEHLAICPECVRYVDSYRRTIAMGRAAFDDPSAPAPSDVPPKLLRAILASRGNKH
jgi:anti-sigma factor RsiW